MKNRLHLPFISNQDRGAFGIAFLYLTLGSLWILFSDKVAARIAPDQAALTAISIYKGWAYVIVTAILLYWLIQRSNTRHEHAEMEMSTLAERLDLATRAAQIGIWDWNIPQDKLVWDDQMYTLYGLKRSDFLGAYEAWLMGMHSDDREPSNEISQQALRGEKEYDTEFRVLWPDGSQHWLKANGQVFRNKNGEPLRMIGVNYDITERKQTEAELKRSNVELEQFAYVASHDLQEPLRAVTGMVQLLQQRYQGKLDEHADEYIGHAVNAAARMQNLINDLLQYSRISRFEKPLTAIDLENCLNNALANLQIALEESNAQVTHVPLPKLMADATQVTQVLQNLIGNAIKFRGARPLHIHIGAQPLEHTWQFTVKDNGIGIQPQHFERIFQVFQRLHTHREYPGTGIGLSLCKKIIERHGGRIWLESQPGEGSVFFFTLPER